MNGLRPSALRNYSYAAAKAGLGQLTVQMARDLNDDHINVNAIAPGPIKSKMTAPMYASEEIERRELASFSMKLWGALVDAASLTILLASRPSAYMTGQVIPCDRGATTIG